MPTSPFKSLTIQPSYGKRTAIVQWDAPELYGAEVYVYRSLNGMTDWTLLNPTTPVQWTEVYQDSALPAMTAMDRLYYRLLAELNDEEYESPAIGVFDVLTRREYGICCSLLLNEWKRLKESEGVNLLYYVPRKGATAGFRDPDTGQVVGDECPSGTTYGTGYEGGYSKPYHIWCGFVQQQHADTKENAEGRRGNAERWAVRALAWPSPVPGGLLVNPRTDERYLIGDDIKTHLFKSRTPIAHDIVVTKLARNHAAYGVPVPPDYQEPLGPGGAF